MSDDEYIYSENDSMEDEDDSIQEPQIKTPASHKSQSLSTPSGSFPKKALPYVCLSPLELQKEQNELTTQVANLTGLSEDHASVLLLHFKWNQEKLLESYMENPEKTKVEAGALQCIRTTSAAKSTKEFFCSMQYESYPFDKTFTMGCGTEKEEHRFSLEGWVGYLRVMVTSKDCLLAKCPQDRCRCVVSPRVWRIILNQFPEELAQYERFLSGNFVDQNRSIKWCPAPKCGFAIRANGPVKDVKCSHCHFNFCFKCSEEAHLPLSCAGLQIWNEKCSNESETANWFVANTKKCPKCHTHIEKNQGCNHMSCGQCKYEFCWICMDSWALHGQSTGGYYACNKFDASKPKTEGGPDYDKAKRDLDKYIHYYTRYQAHSSSLKFASKQRENGEVKMTDAQKSGRHLNWIDVQYIMDTIDLLIECRRVLKFTYAYAYSMEDGPRKTLFEYNQGMLETNTEKLSGLSEAVAPDREMTVNYTKVTAQFLQRLLDEVQREEVEGFGSTMNLT